MSLYSDRLQQFSLGTDFLDCGAVRIAYPDIVMRIDGQTMCLFLVADYVVTNSPNQFVIGAEFKKLRFPDRIALEDPKLAFRSDANRRDAAPSDRQIHWISVVVP